MNYRAFCRRFEAQSLSGVLPLIRAHRPKLPHSVYQILDYRMRDISRSSPAWRRNEISN